MVDYPRKEQYTLDDLREIVRILRHPGGCPWDIEQTHASVRRNLLEEAYEAAEAIDEDSVPHMQEELGDVLLPVFFHASIEEDAGRFTLDDVADGICRKLIYRHPHVFGDVSVHFTGEVLSNWEKLKQREKGQSSLADTVDAVPKSFPALWRAEKMQRKATAGGYPVEKVSPAPTEDASSPKEEIGDVLFEVVRKARELGVDPEMALHDACNRFSARIRQDESIPSE